MNTTPMPYGAHERQRPSIPFLAGNADLLPMPLGDGADLLPAIQEAPVIRIGPGLRQADAPIASIETRQARRDPSKEADIVVPFGQAAITALMVAVAVALLSWAAGWSWKVTVVMSALSLVASWFWRLRLVDSLLWTAETITQRDVTGDGAIGRPVTSFTVANPAQARQAVAQETRQHTEDADKAGLLAFLDKCYLAGCGEHAHGVKASGPARAKYVARRDTLLALGIAEWKSPGNPRAGWRLAVPSRPRARQLLEKHVLARS